MAFAKKKPEPPSAEERGQALLEEIQAVRAKIQDYIEEKVQELKQSQDGRGLPIDFLRAQVHRYECECRCAARLLGDPDA
jgi:hypothetical protein